MGEITFVFSLYLFGLIVGFFFLSSKSIGFILFSAVYWGSFNWVVIGILSALIIGQINMIVMFSIIILEVVALLYIGIKKNRFSLTKKSWILITVYSLLFVLFDILFAKINLSSVSPDSLFILKMSSVIAKSGFVDLTWSSPASVGYFIGMMHTPSSLLGVEYLSNLQPIYSINFAFLFFTIIYEVLHTIKKYLLRISLSVIFTIFLFCSSMMWLEFSYIHTNFITGIFLFILIYCFFNFLNNKDASWLLFGTFAGIGFSLSRTENPITLLIFVTLFLGVSNLEYKLRLKYIVPLIFSSMFFEAVLLGIKSRYLGEMVSVKMVAMFVFIQLLYLIFLILSRWSFIDKKVIPRLHKIMGIVIAAAIVGMMVFYPKEIFISSDTFFKTLMKFGGWDLTWIIMVPLTLLFSCFYFFKSTKLEVIYLQLAIPIYFFSIIVTALFNGPYVNPRWSSSPNRMFTHILPLMFLLLALTIDNKDKSRSVQRCLSEEPKS